MSTIIADNLTGKTAAGNVTVTSEGGAATFQLQQGLAKAWLDYDQTANTTDASYNVSSVSDNAAGLFVLTLTSAMSDANWILVHTVNAFAAQLDSAKTTTTGSCRTRDASANNTDATTNNIAVHGDLA